MIIVVNYYLLYYYTIYYYTYYYLLHNNTGLLYSCNASFCGSSISKNDDDRVIMT